MNEGRVIPTGLRLAGATLALYSHGFAVEASDSASTEQNGARMGEWIADRLKITDDAVSAMQVTVRGKDYTCYDPKKVSTALDALAPVDVLIGESGSAFVDGLIYTNPRYQFSKPMYYTYLQEWKKDPNVLVLPDTGRWPNPPERYSEAEVGIETTKHIMDLYNLKYNYSESKLQKVQVGDLAHPKTESCTPTEKNRGTSLEPSVKKIKEDKQKYGKNAASERRKSHLNALGVVEGAVLAAYPYRRRRPLFRRAHTH